MSRKKKKHHTIVLGGWGLGGFGWDGYDDWDDGYGEPFYGYSTKTETTKTEKVVPDFKVCPTKPLIK